MEGVVGLVLVIGGALMAFLLLMNTGVATYNKEKIGFVANSAASYAATLTDPSTRQANVESLVGTTMSNMGLNSASTVVTIKDLTEASIPAVSVTVAVNIPTLLSGSISGLLPQQVQMTDTAVALKPINTMQYLVIQDPLGGQVTVPLLNNTGALPKDNLPAWSISLQGVKKIR